MIDAPLSAPPGWDDPPPAEGPALRAREFLRRIPHTKGELAAQRLTLGDSWLPWQEKLTRHLFGTLDEYGRRRYTTVYVEMPKKTGKSTYSAALALYLLAMDDEYGGEVYSAAYNEKQAKVVWNIAREMVDKFDPRLPVGRDGQPVRLFLGREIDTRKAYQNMIECPRLGATYEPLSKGERGKHGFNPSAVIFDELHEQPDRAMFDTIRDSMGARAQPLLFCITNAGVDRESVCYMQREYAMRVNAGEIDDPTFLGLIYGAPEDADWTEPEVWRKAHPGLGVTVPESKVATLCEQAKAQPTAQNTFKRWQLSIWTQQVTRWIDPARWDAARERIDWSDMEGARCYGGLDIGSVSDLTAWVIAFPDADDPELVRLKCVAWCPEEQLWDRKNIYREQYQAWQRDGWLKTTPGKVIDHTAVKRQIVEDAETFGLVDMWVDTAFNSHQLVVELGRDHDIACAGGRTTYQQMTAPCDEFERRLLLDPPKLRHDGNPVLAWAVANVALKSPDPDRKRPVKDTESAKIDPVIAVLGALDRCMRHEEPEGGPSKYETEDLLVL